MVLLENDTFLGELTRMFQKSRATGTGSVSMTMKKYDGKDRPEPKLKKPGKASKKGKPKSKEVPVKTQKGHGHGHGTTEHTMACLLRAKLHNRKISTVVSSKDVTRFQMAYCNLLKGNMDGLKKVKKVKGKSTKDS